MTSSVSLGEKAIRMEADTMEVVNQYINGVVATNAHCAQNNRSAAVRARLSRVVR